jgi:L-tartrate/succinate antiporter
LALWIFGQNFVNATTVALIVICLMLSSGIVSWDDIMKNRQAWNALVWFATLVSLAGGLAKVGFTHWLANGAALIFSGIPPVLVMVLLVAVFFFTHYMFASITAHTTAMLPVFLAAGAAIPGMNVQVLVLLLAYSLGIMGILTPYATGPSPIYFGSGYVARKDFWVLGLIFGTIFLVLLLVLGTPYLMAIYR